MSRIMNDEQWKALREWWTTMPSTYADLASQNPDASGYATRLYDAIAPLMNQWSFSKYELGFILRGPDGKRFYVSAYEHREDDWPARLVCDLLNEREAKK